MDRRDFLKSTGGLAAVASGCASVSSSAAALPAAARPAFTVAIPWSAHHAGLAADAHRLARKIEAALGGEAAIEIRHGDAAPADFTVTFVHSATARHPAFAYFGGLPGTESLPPRELESWLTTGGGQHLWDALAERHGVKPLLAGHTGSNTVLWSRTPIATPEDLAGRRIVVRGLDADVIRALGAVAITGDETVLEDALSDPATDAVLWGSLVHAAALDIPRRYPHGLAGALGSAGACLSLNIDLEIWNSLPAAKQTAIAAAANSEFHATLADCEATRAAVEEALTTMQAAKISRPSTALMAAISRIAAAVVAHAAAFDETSSRIDRAYAGYRRAVARPAELA